MLGVDPLVTTYPINIRHTVLTMEHVPPRVTCPRACVYFTIPCLSVVYDLQKRVYGTLCLSIVYV